MNAKPILLYCEIAVLLNGVLALGWRLWYEIEISRKQAEQINELQTQLNGRSGQEPLSSRK